MNQPTNSRSDKEREEVVKFSCFYLDDTLCGIDIDNVQEINENLKITRVPTAPDYISGIMNLRGQIVTVINLSMKIGLSPSVISPESRVIITKSKGEFIGLLVDRIGEVITSHRSSIAEAPANVKGAQGEFFSGLLQVGGSELVALIDTEKAID